MTSVLAIKHKPPTKTRIEYIVFSKLKYVTESSPVIKAERVLTEDGIDITFKLVEMV